MTPTETHILLHCHTDVIDDNPEALLTLLIMTLSATCLGAVLSGHHSSKQISKCLTAWQIIISLKNMSSEKLASTWGLKKPLSVSRKAAFYHILLFKLMSSIDLLLIIRCCLSEEDVFWPHGPSNIEGRADSNFQKNKENEHLNNLSYPDP